MALDVQSLLVALFANVLAIAVAVPLLMGWQVSRGARYAQAGAVLQALAWLLFLSARYVHDPLFSTLSMAALSGSFACMWHALRHWLGERPGKRLLHVLLVATPLGYGLGFEHYAFRVGWSNFGLALLMGLVCLAVAWPAERASWRWRGLLLSALGTLLVITLWRGVLGAFFTESYPFFRAPHPVNLAGALINNVALLLATLGMLAAWREEAERQLKVHAQTDPLTGLLNRRELMERGADLMALARRYGDPLSVLLIDIDHFKRINDTGGHAAGDAALRTMAKGLVACMRRGDLVCRYGGEEFCVLLARTSAASSSGFDERLRAWLATNESVNGGPHIPFSAGVAVMQETDASLEDTLQRADEALYRAKAQGRGQLVTFGEDPRQPEFDFGRRD